MVKYIGSKRALLPWITGAIGVIHRQEPVRTVADLFSGTARVGHALKKQGFYVVSNDLMHYAHVLAQALVEADAREYGPERLEPVLRRLNALPPRAGWFTRAYCEQSRYFQPHNGARIEAIREGLEAEAQGDPLLRAVLLTSLMLAADRVDSTTGIQMAYLKQWAKRSYNDLRLEYPPLLPGLGRALRGDALEVAKGLEADLFYLDPPYNQHSYLGNYHVWETLTLWDRPQTYGVAHKRVDVQERKSAFNLRREAGEALQRLLGSIRARHLVVSFNDEGFFGAEAIEAMLRGWGYVHRLTRPHTRYVGARIGIYNPRGQKVGKVSHTENHEFLFVATHSRKVHEAVARSAGAAAG
ncbi:Modification methylase FokI [Calidithermus terrae]|uniref:Modification methylase FokI n=1 Tax=Calidithermus terrae TaxID=1408545 RepID=A0A399EQT1_9DEIN|nr:DNA adenine methylase [Calidithermus terrae]RIH86994.1 Modification methylase FokI [Calidithermus terrae]